ncbi:hypothetical protein KB206_10800 [Microvirga sp. STS02]|uniref:hypothetical protein n=1 Tax=Hymenobacter negativus TaxID=2795026 RepID=UPI0018DCEB5E|nr:MULTISPECIES: hypothetical protein [Bacteria]MBH8569375.1 hypothetical protein [Hymenobacter negativus]MBR7209109.1 hypothetical protein [Microvirga sp. STS02]
MNTNEVKERPILFSGAMVCALLAGTKTQTRRVVKPQPPEPSNVGVAAFTEEFRRAVLLESCPYGQPGERLWVRETWGTDARLNFIPPSALFSVEGGQPIYYRADDKQPETLDTWRPSIHMPRAASRILLEIVSVRVERLQEISEADAVAEGVEATTCYDEEGPSGGNHAVQAYRNYLTTEPNAYPATASFCTLWQSINGPDSWAANPWVWVVEFKVVQPEKEVANG